MTKYGFPKTVRLLATADFRRVYAAKVFAADDTLVLNAIANDRGHLRLGLSISKKVGNAIVRNRWKRHIREAFRLQQHELATGMDIVVRPRKDAVCDSSSIHRSITKLVRRAAKKI
jgi:ribonuclease P protein component